VVYLAAARVGGIYANNTYPADFILDNLKVQNNVIESAWRHGAQKLLFLGSSCIYPKMAPQPLKEEYLLTSPLEPTNEPYAVAKIAGIKLCSAMNRQYGTNFISVMPTNLYGPNDNCHKENAHVLPMLLRRFHEGKSSRNPRSSCGERVPRGASSCMSTIWPMPVSFSWKIFPPKTSVS
jgi:GDP-L-fucose synthase